MATATQDVPVIHLKPESRTLTLMEKLAAACDAVSGIEKRGKNIAQNYAYVKAADVAKSIRHELFSRGVVILQDEEAIEWTEFQTMKGSTMRECRLKIAYTITDGQSNIVLHAYGVAMDSGDKAIYKAKTGATKYFLRGLGLIPDEKDDPEADESVDRAEFVSGLGLGEVEEQCEWIANASTLEELKRIFAAAYAKAAEAKDRKAMAAYIKAKDQRKAELS